MAVLKIERYLIGNQCSAFLTGVMREYLVTNSGKGCSEHIEVLADGELRDLWTESYSNQDDFRPEHWQP